MGDIILFVIGAILAYLLGSIPTAVWIGKTFFHTDIRTQGSGNAGATNTIRVLGLRAGLPVLIIDILKGWLAVSIAHFSHDGRDYFPDLLDYKIILAIAAVMGHIFPVYAGFRGGKGIATLLGIGIALYPVAALIAFCIFLAVFFMTRYVSLSSIIASVTFPVVDILILGHSKYPSLMIMSILVAIFVPIIHHRNIRRLLRGEEHRFRLNSTNRKVEN
ncbi:MAG: glycerol-3-phosphate 1-O-acyltransferase PlsY [Bacteroidales bacterium]|nr:glycerol-3-phosphate 1-O-acyltransferase PlsY [Bacteroidales bacterium]